LLKINYLPAPYPLNCESWVKLHDQVIASRYGKFPDGDLGGVRRLHLNEWAVKVAGFEVFG
jgi:hypothetical protein